MKSRPECDWKDVKLKKVPKMSLKMCFRQHSDEGSSRTVIRRTEFLRGTRNHFRRIRQRNTRKMGRSWFASCCPWVTIVKLVKFGSFSNFESTFSRRWESLAWQTRRAHPATGRSVPQKHHSRVFLPRQFLPAQASDRGRYYGSIQPSECSHAPRNGLFTLVARYNLLTFDPMTFRLWPYDLLTFEYLSNESVFL